MAPLLSEAKPCVKVVSSTKLEAAAASSGWCTAVELTASSTPPSPPGTTVTYQVKPEYTSTKKTISVVATGSSTFGASSAARRIMIKASAGLSTTEITEREKEITERETEIKEEKAEEETREKEELAIKEAEAAGSANPFEFGQIVGIESLYLSGNSEVYRGGAASNGRVQLIDSSKICGPLRYGPGTTSPVGGVSYVPEPERKYSNGTGGGICYPPGYPLTQGTVAYPSVVAPSDIKTNNSDARITKKEDVSGETSCPYCNIAWNSSNRALSVNYSSLTLGGSVPYFLCSLTVGGGSTLKAAAGKKISIFFDEPKNCPGLNGGAQLTINGGATISPDSGSGPGFYLLGSASSPTTSQVYFGNGAATARMVIYAPNSVVQVAGGINLNGAIMGRTLKLEGGANINQSSAYTPPPAQEFTTVPKTSAEQLKKEFEEHQKTREKTQEEREKTLEEREETQHTREEKESAFAHGSYVECSAQSSGTPNSGC
jgi:hypothetical protein